MFPKHPRPVAPQRAVATQVVRQRQTGAGPVDVTVIVVERPPQADSARITEMRSDLPSKPIPGKSGIVT
jgi:hypothetical protein